MKIGIFGLGKLGSPMLAVFAGAGHEVFGYDPNPSVVAMLETGKAPVEETGLQAMLDDHNEHYRVTNDPAECVKHSELIFIIVPTPSDSIGWFDASYVMRACTAIGKAIQDDPTGQRLIVVTSTVMPETMEHSVVPELERCSGYECGTVFDVAYNPEFIALGSVIKNMLRPDFTLIGSRSVWAAQHLCDFYKTVFAAYVQPIPPVCAMSLVNAEIAKLALNCYVTMKISFANELGGLCECIPGADATPILDAIGRDTRIGSRYVQCATRYGGPCFPRDCRAMLSLAREFEYKMRLPAATDKINNLWAAETIEKIDGYSEDTTVKRLAILGLTYKPDTNVQEESAGNLLNYVAQGSFNVSAYDPSVPHDADAMDVCVRDADIVVVATAWPEFAELALDHPCHVLDCWRIVNPLKQCAGVVIHYPGKNGTS